MIVLDCEVYSNYFLCSFLNTDTKKVTHFESHNDSPLDRKRLSAAMSRYTTVSFNGNGYDLIIIAYALSGASNADIKKLSDTIIKDKKPSWLVAREWHIDVPKWDHTDIMEVAPGQASLKIYGGRLNFEKMQDLPIEPSATITNSQAKQLREYCVNDLETTAALYNALEKQIDLRVSMSEQYGVDLRSKSDAQIAETVIKSELEKLTGQRYSKPKNVSEFFRYLDPQIISFKSKQLQDIFERILKERFTLAGNGSVKMPEWLRDNQIQIGNARYQMGIGGLHSCEKSQYVKATKNTLVCDWDVASYYPSIILQQRLAPKSLGVPFLNVYQSLVTRRLEAKKSGDKVTADILKVSINGSFGKLGSKYSALYAPDLLIQTTITGQLALLMLIERMEDANIRVMSANTDGIVCHCPVEREATMKTIAWDWMLDTSYTLERTEYSALASRDVNNYIAVKLDGGVKGKGCFASGGLSKNPEFPIVYKAVAAKVANDTPIEQTIKGCVDVCQFVCVRRVQGGAVWNNEYLGKAVRFYYSTSVPSDVCIHYASNSNRVPRSAGAKPLMQVPSSLPNDIDYDAYCVIAEKLLCEIGYA